jgi:polyphosphate glucokinase
VKVLGIDIGGSGIKGAPVDLKKGDLAAERFRIPTPQPATPDACGDVVLQIVKHFKWKGPIGCTIPARIKEGVASTATNIDDGWLGLNVAKLMKQKTGCPAYVLNDADAAGIAEMAFGRGKRRKDVVLLLTVGTGIGSALFTRGKLVPNTELGHIDVLGKNGELYASARTRKEENLSWEDWAKRFQHYLERIEFLLAPDLIIIGGGVSRPKRASEYMHLLHTEAELVTAELQNEAGIIGVAYAARKL